MARGGAGRRPRRAAAEAALESELDRLIPLDRDGLAAVYRQETGREASPALSRDLLLRMLSHRLQEKRLGGLDRATEQLLDSLLRKDNGKAGPVRRLRPGTVLVREHENVTHEVVVTPDGFVWRGETHASLSTIARAITGTSWNGPRFFGLRAKAGGMVERKAGGGEAIMDGDPLPPGATPSRRSRRGSVRPRQEPPRSGASA